ncbi:MAG: hotdog fold thioesterase [Actinomycetes bacterium]
MTDDAAPALAAPDDPRPALLDRVNAMLPGTLAERLGIVFTDVTDGRLVATMPVAGNTQPYGLLHGGASVALAETMGSVAAVLVAGPGRVAVGVDVNATHHRAVRSGLVTGTAATLHAGRTTASFEIAVTDEAGRRVCTSRLTCQLRDAPPA